MKNNLKIGLIAGLVLILIIGACGCVTTNPTPTVAPTAEPTVATVKPTEKPTATPVASTDNKAKGIEANLVSKDYTIVTHFTKTTVDGRTAYKGAISDDKFTYKVTAILTSTTADAISLCDSTVASYKAQGYTVQDDSEAYMTILVKENTMVGIGGYKEIYGTGSPGVAILEGKI